MKAYKKYIVMALGIFLISCEKVIDVDLETEAPRLVIDAAIDWEKGSLGNNQTIRLTTTTDYYNSEIPKVSGANVTVTTSSNTVFNFTESPGTGEYVCNNFVPQIGETYTLKVIQNGETYTATEKMMAVPDIENNIVQNNEGGFGGDEIEITYYYQDNPNEQNHYVYRIADPRISFPQYSAENDENTNGSLTPSFYSNKDLQSGDLLNIKLYGISKTYYDYFKKILNASGGNGSPFATTPSAVRGNLINQTNKNNFAFGYFRLSEVAVKDYVIQ